MNYLEICKQIAPLVGGVEDICEFETDSSHSSFAIICDQESRQYICKEIYDTTLSGTKDCVRYEFMALKLANCLGIAPRPIMYNEDLRIIISEFIQTDGICDISLNGVIDRAKYAKIFSTAQFNENDFLIKHETFERDFKEHMRLLDEAITYGCRFLVLESSVRSERQLPDGKKIMSKKEIIDFKSELDDIYKLCLSVEDVLLKLPFVLSHNDLVADNLLTSRTGEKYMIDFETVGISKEDFIIGQLAVDAEIDWNIKQKQAVAIDVLYNKLNAVFDNAVEYKLFLARVLERYVQNICYGYRQVAIGCTRNYSWEYINLKKQVINFCKKRIKDIKEKFIHEC